MSAPVVADMERRRGPGDLGVVVVVEDFPELASKSLAPSFAIACEYPQTAGLSRQTELPVHG